MGTPLRTFLLIPGLLVGLAACGSASDKGTDAGPHSTADAGRDAGFTKHSIVKDTFCSCPGETAAHFTSTESGGAAVDWKRTFTAATLGPNDHLYLLFDFSGPATWQISLQDADGNDAFASNGIILNDATTWHCVFIDYSLKDSNYSITIDDTGAGASMSATLPTTVAGIHVKYTGTGKSAAWLDSVVLSRLSGASEDVLFEEAFDDPTVGPSGTTAGTTTISTPPVSVQAPAGFCR